MKTFFLNFKVVPTDNNELKDSTTGANVAFWIKERNAQKAESKARHYLSVRHWQITEQEQSAVAVTAEQFADRDTGLAKYRQAQEQGMAVQFVGWSKDGVTAAAFHY